MMNERNKITQVNNLEKEVLLAAKAEKVEMTLNTDSALTSGLLIQRLTELYEDPIEASVRETVSNAMDAVVTACSGRPTVKVYSPTALNPILIIKDNGVGMTYEDLKEIYAKYGASTKMNDLEQIGAYGLGAKAPLAYGSEFTVTSVKDGQKTTIIVAREEMTNFIKIIDSVLTDEPSGTTVSIPVSNSDTLRFQDQIDKYKQIPLDKDLDLYIDDKLIENANYTLISDKVLIHEGKEKVYGRLWINKARITNFVTNLSIQETKNTLKFVIGGWAYDSPVGRNNYYRRNNGIIVELKAGIVGFNSSRDSILENDRYKALEDLIADYITSPQFTDDLTEAINTLELPDFKKVVSEIINARRNLFKIEDGKISIKATTNYKSHPAIPRTFDIEDFTHKETGFNFNDVLKNIPTISKQSVVIREKMDRYSKTAKNAIMDEALYSMFSNTNVSEMNETIDKVFFEGEVGSSLGTLMFNLSTFIFAPSKTENTNLTFITDVEAEKHIKSLKAGRKSIVRMLTNNNNINYNSILVYTEHTKSEMNKMVEGLELANTVNLRIDTAEDMLELLKKYRTQNKVAEKKQQTELGTSFCKYDVSKKRAVSSNVNSVDKSKKNLIVVTKSSSIDNSRLRMMRTWFCNENNLAENEVDLYISLGQHTAVDIDILIGLSKNVMRDPKSEAAGRSKIYFEKIHDNKVELNAINNNAVGSSEKAFMRLLTGFNKKPSSMVAGDIKYKLEMAYEIAAIANFELPKFPTETLKAMEAYDLHSFSDMPHIGGYYSGWGLDETSIEHLLSLVDKSQYELLQNLTLLADNERLLIDKDGKYKLVYYGTVDTIQKDVVLEVYENKYGPNSYNQLLKAQTEAYLDFIKSVIKQMELVEF